VIWSYRTGTAVVVVYFHFFVLSVIFLTMRGSLLLVMVFLIFLLMYAWICLMNPFPGGMILVSDFLMYVVMLLLLTLSLLVVFVRV
jgi:hypothetical protein